jgi:hypothetical protein
MLCTPVAKSNAVKSIALRARQRLYKEFDALPGSLGMVAKDAYSKRTLRSATNVLLGECAPALLAPRPFRHGEREQAALDGWSLIYAYIVLIDDAIDREGSDKELVTIAAGTLLQRGVLRVLDGVTERRRRWIALSIDRFLTETASGAAKELEDRRLRLPAPSFSRSAYSRKLAALKLCASQVTALADIDEAEIDWVAIEALAAGVQLLDDVTDWREDWAAGHYTYLIGLTTQRMWAKGARLAANQATADAFLLGALVTGTFEHVLVKCGGQMRRAMPILNPLATEFVRRRLADIGRVEVCLAKYRLDARRCLPLSWTEEALVAESATLRARRLVVRTDKTLTIVAQDS